MLGWHGEKWPYTHFICVEISANISRYTFISGCFVIIYIYVHVPKSLYSSYTYNTCIGSITIENS